MKILFLDIDGVLCTRRSHLAYGKEGGMWYAWDEVACAAVIKACQHGVKIVLSSTWRHDHHLDDFHAQCRKYGLAGEFFYPHLSDWKTPIAGLSRGAEIDLWLKAHPDITDYKILDDDSDMLDHQMSHFIHTHGEEGMTSDNIKKLLNWSGALKS